MTGPQLGQPEAKADVVRPFEPGLHDGPLQQDDGALGLFVQRKCESQRGQYVAVLTACIGFIAPLLLLSKPCGGVPRSSMPDALRCWRRFKIEPPCRSKFEPGQDAVRRTVVCG